MISYDLFSVGFSPPHWVYCLVNVVISIIIYNINSQPLLLCFFIQTNNLILISSSFLFSFCKWECIINVPLLLLNIETLDEV